MIDSSKYRVIRVSKRNGCGEEFDYTFNIEFYKTYYISIFNHWTAYTERNRYSFEEEKKDFEDRERAVFFAEHFLHTFRKNTVIEVEEIKNKCK